MRFFSSLLAFFTSTSTDLLTTVMVRDEMGGKVIPQHIWHNKEAHVAAPDINLLEMADAPIARRDGDVLELHVHVVFGFDELAAVGLAGGDFEGDDVALCEWLAEGLGRRCLDGRGGREG